MSWTKRLRATFRKCTLEDAIDEELQFHLEMRTREFVASGMTVEEARSRALRVFGNQTLRKEETRDMDTIDWIETLLQDLRYAFRMLRKSPGFATVAVLSLALGIGANTAIFQLIDSIRLRTIPVKNPQELGTVRIADRHWGSGNFSGQYSQLTFPMWEQIRKRQEGFGEIAAWAEQSFNLATGGEVRFAKGIRVSGGFFITPDTQAACFQPVDKLRHKLCSRRHAGLGEDADRLNVWHTTGIPCSLPRPGSGFR